MAVPRTYQSTNLISMTLRNKSAAATEGQADKAKSPVSSNIFELSAQLERQADIIATIKEKKAEIAKKQAKGRQLALNVADSQANLEEHVASK